MCACSLQNRRFPCQIVRPVHDVEPSKSGGKHDPAQYINFLGPRLVLGRPTCQNRPRNKIVNSILLSLRVNSKNVVPCTSILKYDYLSIYVFFSNKINTK